MLKALSICSGIGGLDIAMQSEFIGATTHAYCEIEPYACAVLLARMESGHLDAAPIFPDIFKLDAETLEAANIESVDIVYGGIPCQPFSQAGLRRADDDPRNLWPATRKLLGILGRPAFFVENVAGFTIRNGSEPAYAWTLLDDLAEDGYDFRWVHVRAEDVGAPHRRERFFLLAYTPDSGFIRSARNVVNTSSESIRDDARSMGGSQGSQSDEGIQRQWSGSISRLRSEELGDTDTHSIAKKRIALRTGVWAKQSGTGNELGNSERRSRSSESGEFQPSTVHDGRVFRTQDGQGRADHRMAFPPRPDELERWRDILALYPQLRPSLERSVRGVADGIQDGVDFHRRRRLQALGNAVVPQQAIYAWLLLTSDDWVQS
jgi:DNA (cytosine-5)-methyltransferase 1